MQTVQIPAGILASFMANVAVTPTKPRFNFGKTKAQLADVFNRNEQVRKLCDENKTLYPRLHQSVQDTAWQLLMYYIKNWGKSTAKNYEIRITYSYLRKALNESCCVATLKNHVNKLLKVYRGFFTAKFRGGLGLAGQNTACIVLQIEPSVLQFDDPRHNEAVTVSKSAQEQAAAVAAAQKAESMRGVAAITAQSRADAAEAQKRMAAPNSIENLILTVLGQPPIFDK